MKSSINDQTSYFKTITVKPDFFYRSNMADYHVSNDGPCDLTAFIDCDARYLGYGPILHRDARILAAFISPFFMIEKKIGQSSTKTEPILLNRVIRYDNTLSHSMGLIMSNITIRMSGPKDIDVNELVSKSDSINKPFEIEDLLHFDLTIFYAIEN